MPKHNCLTSASPSPCDILLIHAHRDHFGSVPEDISIGLNVLAAFLREKKFSADIFRGFAHDAVAYLTSFLGENDVRSVGFYCDYENVSLVINLSRLVKDTWGIPVFVGGPQTIGLDEDFFRASGCDAIVRGEGEFVLTDLLNAFFHGKPELHEIDGISYLDPSGILIQRPDRPPIADLDLLPWPDFRLERGSENWHVLPVLTGRGCPYRCAFCYEGGNTKKVRLRSVNDVIGEIKSHFERHPRIKYIFFVDDTFTLQPDRVLAFCKELGELRKKRDFVWFCEGHVQTLEKWPYLLPEMVKAGCSKVFLGIESGSDEVLKMYRKQTTAAMIEKVIGDCIKAGVPQVTGNILIGGPLESVETIDASWRLIERLLRSAPGKFDSLSFFIIPYPNTAISNTPEKFGIRVLKGRENHVLEDFPLTETASFTWLELYQLRSNFNRKISRLMLELYQEGKLEHATIMDNYRMMRRYGVMSRWHMNLMSKYPLDNRYYELLSGGCASRSTDIEADERAGWHPQRVFELWSTVSFPGGLPHVGDRALSSLEYDLLKLCSGKLELRQVMQAAYASYGRQADDDPSGREDDSAPPSVLDGGVDQDRFDVRTLRILSEFENRRWITYARF